MPNLLGGALWFSLSVWRKFVATAFKGKPVSLGTVPLQVNLKYKEIYISIDTTRLQILHFVKHYVSLSATYLHTTAPPCTPSLDAHFISLNILFYKYNSTTQAQTLHLYEYCILTRDTSAYIGHCSFFPGTITLPPKIPAQTTVSHTTVHH
jgi:hypothetical protein